MKAVSTLRMIWVLLSVLLPGFASAQDVRLNFGALEQIFEEEPSEGAVVFDTEESSSDFNLFDYLDISALVGLTNGSSVSRNFSYLRLGGRYDAGSVSFFGNILSGNVSADIELELERSASDDKVNCREDGFYRAHEERCMDVEDLEDIMSYRVEYDATSIDELYLKYTPSDSLELTLGQNRLTLGQFAFLSPVHLLLPVNSEQQIGFSKVDLRVPQLLAEVSFYPTERLQLQLAAILETSIDPAQEKYFDTRYREAGYYGEELVSDSLGAEVLRLAASGYDASQKAKEHFAGQSQQVLRFLYRPNWGAVGFTFWSGALHFTMLENEQIICDGTGSGCAQATIDSQFALHTAPDMPSADAFAVELSYNWGNWTLIAELVQVSTTAEFSRPYSFFERLYQPSDNMRQEKLLEFIKTLGTLRSGQFWFDVDYTMYALGADGRSGDGSWVYNLALLNVVTDLGAGGDLIGSLGAGLSALPEFSLWQQEELDNFDDLLFPTFHISKSHTLMGRPATWGAMLGFFFQFGGVFSYYNVELSDHMSLQLGFESLERISENRSAENDNSDYELLSTQSNGLSLALQIKF